MRRWAVVPLLLSLLGCGGSTLPELDGAQWLWPRGVSKAPATIVLARDFDLDHHPRDAELVLRAADGWVVWVNGVRLAAVATRDQCDVAVLDLDGYLRVGGNRLVLEVRFEGGTAGVIGCVRLDGSCRVPTDEQWWRPQQAGADVLHGWSPEGPRGEGFELTPGDLGARCLAVRPVVSLLCHGAPLDLVTDLDAHGGIATELPTLGRLELAFPPNTEATKIRFEAEGRQQDVLIAAGATSFLDLGPRQAGKVSVSGVPVSAAWLWPWTPACDQ
jgi:hypothetical protein